MGWMITTAEKAIIEAFINFIENVIKKNGEKRIYIWGASVRGTLLGILLEQNNYLDFVYVDSDESKWDSNINGHIIMSPDNLKELNSNGYIVVPVEHYMEIRRQLLSWNMKEEEDFYILKTDLYSAYCTEFFRKYNRRYLVFGETFLRSVLLEERPMESMSDSLYKRYGKADMKILSLPCMGMEESYNYLRKQIALDMCPENLWLFVNVETLSKHHHILPRVQHPDLAEMIQEKSGDVDPDLAEYIDRARERTQNYRLELKHSPRRTFVGEPDESEVQKEYAQQQLLNVISVEYKECLYLIKILALCNENMIRTVLIVVPINYQKAIEFLGEEFNDVYKSNINMLNSLSLEYQCKFWDMSKLLKKQFFETKVTLQDGINREGRKKIIENLEKIRKGEQ